MAGEPVALTGQRAAGPGLAARARGRLVAVWGPVGAPGRTTVAAGVADELAGLQVETCSSTPTPTARPWRRRSGILDEASGLARPCDRDGPVMLDLDALARCALALRTEAARAHRGDAPRPVARAACCCRSRSCSGPRAELASRTVVDCGFCLEEDEELSSTPPPRAATRRPWSPSPRPTSCWQSARPTRSGWPGLVRSLPELRERAPQAYGPGGGQPGPKGSRRPPPGAPGPRQPEASCRRTSSPTLCPTTGRARRGAARRATARRPSPSGSRRLALARVAGELAD